MRKRFADVLRLLVERRVDFMVVGGVAAVLHGAPVSTFDLDVLYSPATENLPRLAEALHELDALYRDPAGRRIRPDVERLAAGGHHLLATSSGPLDVLGHLGEGWTFDTLLSRSDMMRVADFEVRVLDLAALVEAKEHAGRDKDLAMLPVLRETLRLRSE